MTSDEYLSRVRMADRDIQAKLEQLQNARGLLDKTYALKKPAIRARGTEGREQSGWETELTGQVERLLDMKREADMRIAQISDPDERMLLRLRYLCGNTWPEISQKMHCSTMTAYRIHKRALASFSEI